MIWAPWAPQIKALTPLDHRTSQRMVLAGRRRLGERDRKVGRIMIMVRYGQIMSDYVRFIL